MPVLPLMEIIPFAVLAAPGWLVALLAPLGALPGNRSTILSETPAGADATPLPAENNSGLITVKVALSYKLKGPDVLAPPSFVG